MPIGLQFAHLISHRSYQTPDSSLYVLPLLIWFLVLFPFYLGRSTDSRSISPCRNPRLDVDRGQNWNSYLYCCSSGIENASTYYFDASWSSKNNIVACSSAPCGWLLSIYPFVDECYYLLVLLRSASLPLFQDFESPSEAQEALETFAMGPTETVLVIDGPFLELIMRSIPGVLIRTACQAPAVVNKCLKFRCVQHSPFSLCFNDFGTLSALISLLSFVDLLSMFTNAKRNYSEVDSKHRW